MGCFVPENFKDGVLHTFDYATQYILFGKHTTKNMEQYHIASTIYILNNVSTRIEATISSRVYKAVWH